MYLNNGIEVTFARLHDFIFVPNTIGQVGPALSSVGDARNKELKMWMTDDKLFLRLFLKGTEVLVPMTNVAFFTPKKTDEKISK